MNYRDTMTSVSILGAGAWGIGLALTALRAGNTVTLWSFFDKEIQELKEKRENTAVLPGIQIPEEIKLTTALDQAAQANIVLIVTPAQAVRKVLRAFIPYMNLQSYIVICSKGIELESAKLLSEVVAEEIPNFFPAVLSGPNFAKEVAANLPAAATLASPFEDQSRWLASSLSHPHFRLYPSTDVIGVEMASAVKNVLAIACGMVTGAALGENARAAVFTHGMAELSSLSLQKGGQLKTLLSLAGVGDMVLTCTSQTSRNMKLGYELALGKSLDQLNNEGYPLTEGAFTVKALIQMAKSLNLTLPVCEAVYRVLYEGKKIEQEIHHIFSQPFTIST